MYSVDIHAHFFTRGYVEVLEKHGHVVGWSIEHGSDGSVTMVPPNGKRKIGPLDPSYFDIDARLEGLDRQETDLHALSLTNPMCHFADDSLNLDLAQAYNDGTSAFHVAHPDRFVGLITLPMLNADDAVGELERAAKLPGARGVYMGTNVAGHNLSEPRFEAIFDKVAELKLPIFLHPSNVLGADRLTDYHTINTIGNPTDSAVAATFLIFGGILDRHPNLEVNLPHAGGTFPILIGRIDHAWTKREECKHLENAPSTYLRRFTYDTIGHANFVMKYLTDLVGVDRVLLGSDYCFDMGHEKPVQNVMGYDWLTEDEKRAIIGGNACRILGMDMPADAD
jgi:aminocarboxymuconate-semialdehyde decarboxylase